MTTTPKITTLSARAGATTCTNCGHYLALVTNPGGGPLLTFDFEPDGYTASNRRHACGETDRALLGGWS